MNTVEIKAHLKRAFERMKGSTIEFDLSSYYPMLDKINKLEKDFTKKSDDQLRNNLDIIKNKIGAGVQIENYCADIYGLVREVSKRTLHLRPFDVQILGALVLHQGKLAEMSTGEGKTLSAVFPACLNALQQKGVHILTFNDYLARRDAMWMGPIYQFLDLTVGYVQEGQGIKERQKAYAADVTYVTAKEAGFDYLRDSLCYDKNNLVHRPFFYAIIDEADSILLDEARIPLVIAGSSDDFIADTYLMAQIAAKMENGYDFSFDDYGRNIHLSDNGQKRAEKLLRCNNLYAEKNIDILTRLHCALHAEFLLKKDVDYIVRNDKIELVDEFTGRVADKRRWPDGLQAALEAKENIKVQSRGNILNSISLQHFIQLYPKLCGMTATAQSSEEEFRAFYNMHIVVIPPNKPCIREDFQDIIFFTREEKNRAIIEEINRIHKTGRPVLVGTSTVEESITLAEQLEQQGISCNVLNAKRDEFEAAIVAEAGKLNAVTISTNMAGRGTDIRLGGSDEKEKACVLKLGGLYVIGTNKHESSRIDKQLSGRAGRQGDPGASRYFISLHDPLYVKYKLSELLPDYFLNQKNDGQLENPQVRRETDRVQRICDRQNLEIKKTLFKYSSLLEKQRFLLYQHREDILKNSAALEFFKAKLPSVYKKLSRDLDSTKLSQICKNISLFCIDKKWADYLAEIADIREGIHLKRLGGKDPYIEFQKLSVTIFDEALVSLEKEQIDIYKSLKITNGSIDLEQLGIKAPTATWTYLINDNPFENILGVQLIGDIGMQLGAGILGPLMSLSLLFKRKQKK